MLKENYTDIGKEDNSRKIFASRVDRLFAAIIDTVIVGGLSILLFFARSGWQLDTMYSQAKNGRLDDMFYILAIFIFVNGYLLHSSGQTVGKKFLEIKIVRNDGRPASFLRILFLRFLPVWVVQVIPWVSVVYSVANVLPIFGKSKRCLHDYLADTVVVKLAID